MNILEKNATYTLYRDFTLSSGDEQVLFLLYLPMLKSDALCLFKVLYTQSTLEQQYQQHDELLPYLGMNESRFLEARSKLEAIGLLETFRKEDDNTEGISKVTYLYHLLPPASPKKFFRDPLLKVTFSSLVGQKRYFQMESYFKAKADFHIDDKTFVDVSTPFRDVYDPQISDDSASLFGADSNPLPDKNYKTQSLFDEKRLVELLRNDNYDLGLIQDKLKDISSICSLYGVTEEEAKSLVLASTNTLDGNRFYAENFQKTVRQFHTFKRDQVVNKKENIGKGNNAKLLRIFESQTPQNYLAIRLNASPNQTMLETIEHLSRDFGFSNGIINVLLDYMLRKTNDEFNAKFLDSVAYSLSAKGVASSSEAMVILSTRDFEKNRSLSKKGSMKRTTKKEKTETKDSKDEVSKDELHELADELAL